MSNVAIVSSEVGPRLKSHLVASARIETGEVIFSCRTDEITRERTWRTIQIDYNRHVKNELLDYVDHSCHPNAVFEIEHLALVAVRPIDQGDAITFFYPGAEVELARDFDCRCEGPACLGHVKGGFYLTAPQMRWALGRGYCTSFMKEQFERLLHLPVQW